VKNTFSIIVILSMFLMVGSSVAQETPQPPAEEIIIEIIEPRQTLNVEVFQEDDLTRSVVVDPEGYIIFPLIGRVKVAGLTELEATKLLHILLEKDYLVNPQVSLHIAGEGEVWGEIYLHEYVILGEIKEPGTYEYDSSKGEMTLLKAISLAGGFRSIANTKKVRVLKRNGGDARTMTVNVEAIIDGKQEDLVIDDNDLISVPESLF